MKQININCKKVFFTLYSSVPGTIIMPLYVMFLTMGLFIAVIAIDDWLAPQRERSSPRMVCLSVSNSN